MSRLYNATPISRGSLISMLSVCALQDLVRLHQHHRPPLCFLFAKPTAVAATAGPIRVPDMQRHSNASTTQHAGSGSHQGSVAALGECAAADDYHSSIRCRKALSRFDLLTDPPLVSSLSSPHSHRPTSSKRCRWEHPANAFGALHQLGRFPMRNFWGGDYPSTENGSSQSIVASSRACFLLAAACASARDGGGGGPRLSSHFHCASSAGPLPPGPLSEISSGRVCCSRPR